MANKKQRKAQHSKNDFNTERTRDILAVNPIEAPQRVGSRAPHIEVFDYSPSYFSEVEHPKINECFNYKENGHITWINVGGIRKEEIDAICNHYNIHFLIIEDILSNDQRPKMDEMDNVMFCLLNMLYFNETLGTVETEQISILLGKDYVISFQDDAERDVFNVLREKLRLPNSKIRQEGADYLCYALIDSIVDKYYLVMEKLGDRIEDLEDEIIEFSDTTSLSDINNLRKEMIVLKRNVSPVRDLVNGFIRTESDLLDSKTKKYFKDIYDHIIQANDLSENLRDMLINLQDLYLSKVNLKMNEVMKVMAIVTCLMAPATVIGGIFGMNFESIPTLHNQYGFFIAVTFMVLVPLYMLINFKRRGWF
jgi:magnesium transporter